MIGQTVGKYRILDRLGRGGMGTVYKAIDETLDREVAIKVLNPDLTDADVLKRFRAEAVTLARLNHPGIATIYELHRHGDELLMVMEFVRGETFHDLADRLGPLAPPQAVHLCTQVLDALAHAHRAGVVHRDLKPANLMVTEIGTVKVMDFGIARVLGSEHFTHGGYMMGTPAYMAPEQVLGRDIDGRADLYSVGVVLYRLLSGELPFKADTAIAMVQKQVSEPPTPIQTFRPDLPAWCTAVLDRALAKDPADRFQTADELRGALSSLVKAETLGELPTMATPTPPGLAITAELTRQDAVATVRTDSSGSRRPATSADVTAVATPVSARISAPVASLPTPTASRSLDRTTTTVVLGRTHLAAIGAVVIVLAIGVAVLAFVALRPGPGPLTAQRLAEGAVPTQAAAAGPSEPAPQNAPATTPDPTTPAAPAAPDAPPPVPPPGTVSGTPATPDRGVATVGAVPPTPKTQPARTEGRAGKPVDGPVPATNTTASKTGRGATAAKDKSATPVTEVASTVVPPLVFNDVRVLVANAGKAREREGVLQLADNRMAVLDREGGTPIVSVPYSAVVGAYYSRSKQPKWKDADGKEVESKIDLGRLGFLRGERNWLILMTGSEPLIIRLEDSGLRTVLPAFQERTGIKVQR
jgi:serine/threonine-protein kinase